MAATQKKKQQEAPAPQVEARIDRMVDGDYKTKAYASVTIAGAFAVHGLRVIETDKGRFISMPQESYKKNGKTVYNDTFHAVTAEARTALVDAVNDAYEQRLQERIPKGNFIVQKTGQHPMRTRLRLFLEWGITFEKPYIVPERADRAVAYANREDLERNLPQSSKAENADMRGAYAVSGRGGIAHEPAVDKPRRRGGKQMKTYGEEDL